MPFERTGLLIQRKIAKIFVYVSFKLTSYPIMTVDINQDDCKVHNAYLA